MLYYVIATLFVVVVLATATSCTSAERQLLGSWESIMKLGGEPFHTEILEFQDGGTGAMLGYSHRDNFGQLPAIPFYWDIIDGQLSLFFPNSGSSALSDFSISSDGSELTIYEYVAPEGHRGFVMVFTRVDGA